MFLWKQPSHENCVMLSPSNLSDGSSAMTKLVLKTEAADAMRVLSVEEISLIAGASKLRAEAERLRAEAESLVDKANDAGKFSKTSAVEKAS
jgi:hypothetical protein